MNGFVMAVTYLRQESGSSHGLHPPELCDRRGAEVEVRRGDVFLVGHVSVVVRREYFFGVTLVVGVEVYPALKNYRGAADIDSGTAEMGKITFSKICTSKINITWMI